MQAAEMPNEFIIAACIREQKFVECVSDFHRAGLCSSPLKQALAPSIVEC